ncbi:hypothetical protein RU01_19210 [Rhodococcus sp. MEB064]|nr:hypothetical protein RU01_19210 [Rhodococcus sp. MEB064]
MRVRTCRRAVGGRTVRARRDGGASGRPHRRRRGRPTAACRRPRVGPVGTGGRGAERHRRRRDRGVARTPPPRPRRRRHR